MDKSPHWDIFDSFDDTPSVQMTRTVMAGIIRMSIIVEMGVFYNKILHKILLDDARFGRRGTDLTVTNLHRPTGKRDLSKVSFLVDEFASLTAVLR